MQNARQTIRKSCIGDTGQSRPRQLDQRNRKIYLANDILSDPPDKLEASYDCTLPASRTSFMKLSSSPDWKIQ